MTEAPVVVELGLDILTVAEEIEKFRCGLLRLGNLGGACLRRRRPRGQPCGQEQDDEARATHAEMVVKSFIGATTGIRV